MTQSDQEIVFKPMPRVLGGTVESIKKAKQSSQKHGKPTTESRAKVSISIGDQLKEVKKSLVIGKTTISMMMDRKLQKTFQDIGNNRSSLRKGQKNMSKGDTAPPEPIQEEEDTSTLDIYVNKQVDSEQKVNAGEDESTTVKVADDTESIFSFVSALASQSPKPANYESDQDEESDELDLAVIELGQLDHQGLPDLSHASSTKAQNSLSLPKGINLSADQPGFTSETWNAIFHPLSTFKHKKGELEYYPWNSANLPVAAVQVAQRVHCPLAYDSTVPTTESMDVKDATLPEVMPTPYLDNSLDPAVDTEQIQSHSIKKQASQPSLKSVKLNEHGRYYDMLQEIRGGNRYSVSSIGSQNTFRPAKAVESTTVQWRVDPMRPNAAKINNFLDSLNLRAIGIPDRTEKIQSDKNQQPAVDPELLTVDKARVYSIKRIFWLGFICPFLWVFGSFYVRMSAQTHIDPNVLLWQRKCRIALIYASLVLTIVILVVSVNAAGAAAIRQTQTSTIRAVIAD